MATKQSINSQQPEHNLSKDLVLEILNAIKNVKAFGSVEIYIQNSKVTQITTRTIKKTKEIFKRE